MSVTTFAALSNMSVVYYDRDNVSHRGEYLFTLDWAQGDYNELRYGYSETADNHKCGHVIKLDSGNFAIQPNNRLRFFDPSFTTKSDLVVARKINTHTYRVENNPKYTTEDSNNFYYQLLSESNNYGIIASRASEFKEMAEVQQGKMSAAWYKYVFLPFSKSKEIPFLK